MTGVHMESSPWLSILIGFACAVTVAVALWYVVRRPCPDIPEPRQDGVSLLFDDGQLVDADDAVWTLLPDAAPSPAWDEVRSALLPYFAALPKVLPAVPSTRTDNGVTLSIQLTHAGHRVSFRSSDDARIDWFEAKTQSVALARMQPALVHAPHPIWSLAADGQFAWGNDAFAAYATAYGGPAAFAAHITGLLSKPDHLRSKRIELEVDGQSQKRWLEVITRETDIGTLFFATSVDAVVRAEEAQRNFVQTLSKTFANLTTGLAIFDRDRRLALFNPALIDLSDVSVDFLSSRPALFDFFDKLREKQIMPEPKNYDDWRERMAKLVAAASDDRFRETWNLAGGQTLDVTGRPYPDGAIAFLFNDITAEVSLTRGFRTELETMQSALDVMEDAVAVFNQRGILTLCNDAYKRMWQVDPDTSITDATILEATQDWKSAFHPSPVWPELRDFVTSDTERASWDTELRSRDGREVICRIDPICYGATLIRFCQRARPPETSTGDEGLQIVSA